MSATPSWAITQPSMYSTIECTIDCGCTTTCTWSGATSNSQRASMISSPLFISVAESIVILAPIFQVGCWSASSTVTVASSRLGRLAERAAGGREQDAVHVAAVVADQALEDRAVLGVDRQQRDAARPRGRGHEAARHHQRLLVGERHGAPGLDGGHRRQQAGAADERRDHDVGVDVAGQRHQPVGAGEQLRARRRQQPRQPIAGVRVEQRDGARRVLAAEVGDALDVRAARREARHRELVGEARHELERAQTDGAGRAEERDALHARHPAQQRDSSRTPGR